jgi:hypothetical protein
MNKIVAVSVAAAVPTVAPAMPADEQPTMSEARALAERCRTGNQRWDILFDEIDRIEEAVRDQHGRRPSWLIAWRNYSAIGGIEIEWARERFLSEGDDPKVVEKEYRAAKRRFQRALEKGRAWDEEVGLTELRKEYEDNRLQTLAAWEALGSVDLKSTMDAVAIITVLRERAELFDELSEDWEVAAFKNASRYLVRNAA